MKLRFTIRDFIWLIIVLGLLIGWGIYGFRYRILAQENMELKARVSDLKKDIDQIESEWASYQASHERMQLQRAAAREAAKGQIP